MQHVMIDIETLGTAPGCAILSIGAVMFDRSGLGPGFYCGVSLRSCIDAGLRIEPDTVAWWMRQSDAARAAAFAEGAVTLPQALIDMGAWLKEREAVYVWCQGAAFDVPILEAAYRACGLPIPWRYYDVRDTRTLYQLADVEVDRSAGTHHNALDDAIAQAEAAREAFARLGVLL